MSLLEIFAILIIHWIADFLCQTTNQATKKSESFSALIGHTWTYSVIWYWVCFLLAMGEILPASILWFPLITFIFHTLTDYYTSKICKKFYVDNNLYGFFSTIGFDQILHYVQLFLTYQLLK